MALMPMPRDYGFVECLLFFRRHSGQCTLFVLNPCFFRCNSRVLLPPAMVFLNTSVTGKSPRGREPGQGAPMNTGQFPTILADEYHAVIASIKPLRTEARASRPPGHASRCPRLHFPFLWQMKFFVNENNFFSIFFRHFRDFSLIHR